MSGFARRSQRAAFAMAIFLPALPASAQVRVDFVEPQRYTDADNRFGSGPSLRATLAEIRRLIEQNGTRVLKLGETLSIEVLDIDLAGMNQMGGAVPYGLRVVTDITPPRFRFRYTLKERGRIVLSATESISDLNFLSRYARLSGGASFHYERELLRDWFQSRIALRRPPLS